MAIEERMLRDALVTLAEQLKTQYVMLSATLDEVAALRETVRGLDPTFLEVLEKQRKDQSSGEIQRASIALLNEIIRRLKTDVIHEV